MEHAEARKKLSEYLDGISSSQERADIEAHLQGCDRCRAALAELEKTVGHLRGIPREEPPPWLTARIMARVRAEAEKPNLWKRLFYPFHIKLPVEALALVALCVTGYYLARTTSPTLQITSPQVLEQGAPPQPVTSPARPGDGAGRTAQTASVRPVKSPTAQRETQTPPSRRKTEQESPSAPGFVAPKPPLRISEPPPAAIPPAPAVKSLAPPLAESPPPASVASNLPLQARERASQDAMKEERGVSLETMKSAKKAKKANKSEMAGGSGIRDGASSLAVSPGTIVLRATDPAIAGGKVARAVTGMGGVLLRREPGIAGERLTIRIDAVRVNEFLARLEKIGHIGKKPVSKEDRTGFMELVVEIEPDR